MLLASFYDQFIAAVGHRLSPLRLAQFAGVAATARAASQNDTPAAADAAAEFLEAVASELSSSIRHRSNADEGLDGPVLYLRSLATQHRIRGAKGPDGAVRSKVREHRRELKRQAAASQASTGFGGGENAAPPAPPPAVSAAVHATAAALAAADGDAGAFYRASLARLAFARPGDVELSGEGAARLALDVGAAALLADDVFSFGELLLHPIVAGALGGGGGAGGADGGTGEAAAARGGRKRSWLGALLRALADGDVPAFEAACDAHASDIASARPAVAEAAKKGGPLRAKARVCALFALAASLPPEGRRAVPLSRIAEVAGLVGGEAEAEFLVMKAVAKGLVRATIDGVEGTVHVSFFFFFAAAARNRKKLSCLIFSARSPHRINQKIHRNPLFSRSRGLPRASSRSPRSPTSPAGSAHGSRKSTPRLRLSRPREGSRRSQRREGRRKKVRENEGTSFFHIFLLLFTEAGAASCFVSCPATGGEGADRERDRESERAKQMSVFFEIFYIFLNTLSCLSFLSLNSTFATDRDPRVVFELTRTHTMNALFARQQASGSWRPRQHPLARDGARSIGAIAPPPAPRKISTAAFLTSSGGGTETQTHDGSSPFVLQAQGATSLPLEERAGRVYATAALEKKAEDGDGGDEDGLVPVGGPPPPSGVFLAGAELLPGTSYLLSPGAEISFSDAAGRRASVTVSYEVSENGGIGGLGEVLARAMAAQASDEVRAKLDDVF